MKKWFCVLALGAMGLVMTSCLAPSYSVSEDAVREMLDAPGLAVTPFQPVWLNEEGTGIWPLSEENRIQLCAILRSGQNRHVPELAYQTDDEHSPLVQKRFYIYATNGQCLAGTVLENRVAMHDLVLTEEQERELFRILTPYLKKVFTEMP